MTPPLALWIASLVALAAALVSAVLLTRRAPSFRPLVALWAFRLAIDLVSGHPAAWGLTAAVEGAPRPLTDGLLLAYVANGALLLSWPAALVVASSWVFARWRALAVVSGIPAVVVGTWWLASTYPHDRELAQRILFGGELGCLAAAAVAIVIGWGVPRPWDDLHRVVFLASGAELVVALLGPFRLSVFHDWHLALIVYTVLFAAVAFVQARALRRLPPPSAGSQASTSRGDL